MLSFRRCLGRASSIHNVNYFRYYFIKFRGNGPIDFNAVVHGSCQRLVFDDWNRMLLGYSPDLYGYEVFSFGKNQRRASFFTLHNEALWRNGWDSRLPTA